VKRKIKIEGREIEFQLRRKRGMKNMRLSIYPEGYLAVSAPKWYPLCIINRFIQEKSDWIFERIKKVDFDKLSEKEEAEKDEYKKLKEQARGIIGEKVELINQYYNFSFNRISIKNQRSCWGSCSQRKNLNFNYKIIKLPEVLKDYIIIHELCHLEEMNHSRKFWKLVSASAPNYKILRKELKKIRI
jgi:predicted metal-dependent hydrolase